MGHSYLQRKAISIVIFLSAAFNCISKQPSWTRRIAKDLHIVYEAMKTLPRTYSVEESVALSTTLAGAR